MALAGFSLDISSIEVVKDPQLSAILSSLARNHPGGYRVGDISLKTSAPAIIGDGGNVVAVPAELGTFLSTTIRYSMTYRAEEAAEVLGRPGKGERMRPIIFPATSFTLTAGPDERIRYRVMREDGEPVMYLAAVTENMHAPCQAALLVRQTVAGMRMYSNWIPVVVAKEDVRAYLTDRERFGEVLMKKNPGFIQERIR